MPCPAPSPKIVLVLVSVVLALLTAKEIENEGALSDGLGIS